MIARWRSPLQPRETRGCFFFFSSRRRHTRCSRDWSSDVCSSDLDLRGGVALWGYQGEEAYFSNLRISNSTPLPVKNGSDATGAWQVKCSSDAGTFDGTLQLARDANKVTGTRSEEHTSELQSRLHLVCRLLLEKKKK